MRNVAVLVLAIAAGAVAAGAQPEYSPWDPVVSIEAFGAGAHPDLNGPALDGCPSVSRDGLTFYFASNRTDGSQGGIDLWVTERTSTGNPWGEPRNLGAPVNSSADDFCPGPTRDGRGLLFVSTRAGGCGGSDIYISRRRADGTWDAPLHLGCDVNSAGDEASPIVVEYDDGTSELYFSSTRAGGVSQEAEGVLVGDADIYVSQISPDGSPGTPQLVPGINTAAQDARPHLRRDGLEIFFDSNRSPGAGGFDIWTATRDSVLAPWSLPENLGTNVNSAGNETRPFLSWDARTLYVGSTRAGEGSTDIYVTTRQRVKQP